MNGDLLTIDLTLVGQIINFLVVIYIVKKFFIGKLSKILEERQGIVLKNLNAAKEEKEKAESLFIEAENVKKQTRIKSSELIATAEKKADERRESILKEAHTSREKMMTSAETDIEKMKHKAKEELKKEVQSMATTLAEKMIKENIGDNKGRTIDNFINEIGE